ncbi:MAG TPA: glycine cleavage system protein GcvH [Clostridiaceae bacterium]|nr:glycine cleavage system protein GcvH [Clostridiaceae bacterium]HBF76998.1 glycine cleavage system protein GcvH [Clostridiaceae bacterium]HBG38438.1 glycine cleavage system protein GcvH [Clostridiaceae bacterium]HBN28680.1 glycine cleavage system protein GcvH [Clostridiaceae bacterium]HBX47450.1 glycine cleavage system protein GcvH [Clostridiaceae bacterium]
MKVVKNLLYTKDHEWAKVEGEFAYIGITDFAQDALGDIVFVDLPEVGSEFKAGDSFGAIESVKAASDAYIPVSGKVVEVNEDIVDNPALVNEDAYENWFLKIELSDKSELGKLMDDKTYEEYCSKEG